MKAFDLDREQFLAGFMPDEQLCHVAGVYAREATQEYESARWSFARRHQPDYGPTRWADLVRQRLRMCRQRRAIAAFYFVEVLKREAAALTTGCKDLADECERLKRQRNTGKP